MEEFIQGSWEEIEQKGNIYSARTGHCAFSTTDAIYIFGGTDGDSRKSDLYCFKIKD